MPQKLPTPYETKIREVERYLNEECSLREGAKRAGVNVATMRQWVHTYRMRGAGGLCPSAQRISYPVSIKKQAAAEYSTSTASQREICLKYNISTPKMLRDWIKQYNGHERIKPRNSGGVDSMAKGRTTTLDERIEIVSYCIAENKDYAKAIEQYGVSYQQIYLWVRKYEAQGIEGLHDHRGKRKTLSEMGEAEMLRAQIKLKDAENRRLRMENELLKKLAELEGGRSGG